jgi:cellulose synthase/poly-beta-1,6-N-acetylglucosamine synthase-like glycosyltransferase
VDPFIFMNIALIAVLLVPVGILLLVSSLLLVQVVAALTSRYRLPQAAALRPRVGVLVPAHNESSGILATLASVRPQLVAGDRLIVIADNCTDDTAQIAAANGAEVLERHDTTRRGKGYALAFGVAQLALDAPEVVVIVDADCIVQPHALETIARQSMAQGKPVQALYLMKTPASAGPMAPIAEFAWVVKNLVRPLGYHQLGQPCQLMGTGMAFPWPVITQVSLASGHIVEDLKMGIELAGKGFAPVFCPGALVTSLFPENHEGVKSQRTRWEHGHLGMIASEAPRYFLQALKTGNGALLALVLDLCVPPLALLTLLVLASCAIGAAMWVVTGEVLVLQVAGLTLVFLGLAILLAWVFFGRQVLSFARLAYAPIYALRKIPLYAKFLVHKQVDWIRSKRDPS